MNSHKNYSPRKLRNIRLVKNDDSEYREFLSNIKLEAFHLRPSNKRSYSDIISYPLEKTIRSWIESSGLGVEERVISYEVLKNEKYQKTFNELDVVFFKDGKYWLVEVKVSSSDYSKPKAIAQLINADTILKQVGLNTELLIVHVNLDINDPSDHSRFQKDFSNMDYYTFSEDGYEFKYIILKPNEIFNWGLEKNLIDNADLLTKTLEEVFSTNEINKQRKSLIKNKIPKHEWPVELVNVNVINNDQNYCYKDNNSLPLNHFAEKLREVLNKG